MTIKVGSPAPCFSLPDAFEKGAIALSDLRGKKVLLSFYRYASCPFCNLRISKVRKEYHTLQQQGMEVVSIFHSPPRVMRKYVGRQDLPFPLLADPEEEVYKMYEVKSSFVGWVFSNLFCTSKTVLACCKGFFPGRCDGNWFTLPADFLIDENGIVQGSFYARTIDEHMPWERIESFAKKDTVEIEEA